MFYKYIISALVDLSYFFCYNTVQYNNFEYGFRSVKTRALRITDIIPVKHCDIQVKECLASSTNQDNINNNNNNVHVIPYITKNPKTLLNLITPATPRTHTHNPTPLGI